METTAIAIASFTVVLAETLVSVGLSTLIPDMLANLARTAKCGLESKELKAAFDNMASAAFPKPPGVKPRPAHNPLELVNDVVHGLVSGGSGVDALRLLVPKTATIEAEFEFHGNESYGMNAELGCMIELVTVKGGFSALFETRSSSKIKLTLNMELAEYPIRC